MNTIKSKVALVTALAAQMGGEVSLHYAASKAGQIGMMHFYAKNLAKEGITVNAIAPAVIDTDMVAQLVGKTEEIAEAAVFLVRNGYVTGQTIPGRLGSNLKNYLENKPIYI